MSGAACSPSYCTTKAIRDTDPFPETARWCGEVDNAPGNESEIKTVSNAVPKVDYQYDAEYRLTQLKDGVSNVTQHHYDTVGNLDKMTYPGGKVVSGGFDADHNPTSFTNARNQQTTLNLAPDDSRVTGVTYPAGTLPNTAYAYDDYGRVTVADNGMVRYTYQYDDLDNVTDVATHFSYNNGQYYRYDSHIQYTYNRDGSRNALNSLGTGVLNGGIGKISYIYDDNGNIKEIDYPWKDVSAQTNPPIQKVTYFYDDSDRLTRQVTNALITDYTYDARNELTSLVNTSRVAFDDTSTSRIVAQFTGMTYDGAGNRLSCNMAYYPYSAFPTTNNGTASGFNGTATYTYDDKDRLTSETMSRPAVAGGSFYSYPYTNYTFTHATDEANNLITLRSQANIGYYVDNQVSSAVSNISVGFDFDGNTTKYNNQTVYTFDVENRISGYGGTPTVGYTPDGLRAYQLTGSVTGEPTFYFYDGSHLLYEIRSSTTRSTDTTYAYGWGATGISQKAQLYPLGLVTHYAFDPQGSPVSDYHTPNGYNVPANWSDLFFYDAFGQLREAYSRAGTSQGPDIPYSSAYGGASDTFGPVGFGGQWGYYTDYPSFSATYGQGAFSNVGPYAATSGQLLLGHRYYDPLLARFLSRDPIGYEGGINLYAYCGNNPIGNIDPSGLQTVTILTVEEAAKAGYVWVQGHAAVTATGTVGVADVMAGTMTVGAASVAATAGGIILIAAAGSYTAYHLSGKYLAPLVGGGEGMGLSAIQQSVNSDTLKKILQRRFAGSPQTTTSDVPGGGKDNKKIQSIVGWGTENGIFKGQRALERAHSLTQADINTMAAQGFTKADARKWQAFYWKVYKAEAARGQGRTTPFYRWALLKVIADRLPR